MYKNCISGWLYSKLVDTFLRTGRSRGKMTLLILQRSSGRTFNVGQEISYEGEVQDYVFNLGPVLPDYTTW